MEAGKRGIKQELADLGVPNAENTEVTASGEFGDPKVAEGLESAGFRVKQSVQSYYLSKGGKCCKIIVFMEQNGTISVEAFINAGEEEKVGVPTECEEKIEFSPIIAERWKALKPEDLTPEIQAEMAADIQRQIVEPVTEAFNRVNPDLQDL
jgi:hypothetical protein